jgi:hypothetical protein
MALNVCLLGECRLSMLIWCRRTRISAANEARDRNNNTSADQIRLQASLIRQKHRAIRLQLLAELGFRQGQAKVSLKAICSEMKLDPRIAREKLRIAVREAKKYPELAKIHKPRSAWEWPKGSAAEKEARSALTV